jgi:predicted ArsR family transcriptional regulator
VSELTDAKRRIVERLKRVESATAPELAAGFELTDTAMRQHLEGLEALGLVERTTGTPNGRGRPPLAWSLTALAHDLFPDRHAELT